MDQARQFINMVGAGDNVSAKDLVDSILSARAFEALEAVTPVGWAILAATAVAALAGGIYNLTQAEERHAAALEKSTQAMRDENN